MFPHRTRCGIVYINKLTCRTRRVPSGMHVRYIGSMWCLITYLKITDTKNDITILRSLNSAILRSFFLYCLDLLIPLLQLITVGKVYVITRQYPRVWHVHYGTTFFFVDTGQCTGCTYEIHEGCVYTIQVFFVICAVMRLTYV